VSGGRPPAFINCRDRLKPLRELLAWLGRAGVDEIYLIDNDSAYPPLLDFYRECPHEVIRLGRNAGNYALFTEPGLRNLAGSRPFVYSDPDVVPVPECPLDALDRFAELLERYPEVSKVGFGLVIDDLPRHYPHRRKVIRWEHRFWLDEVEPSLFRADIDTTFALYREGARKSLTALRTGRPYVARHTPWYVDPEQLDDEERFYQQRVATYSHWGRGSLQDDLAPHVGPKVELRMLYNRVRRFPPLRRFLT
jgi:hypothetical protein